MSQVVKVTEFLQYVKEQCTKLQVDFRLSDSLSVNVCDSDNPSPRAIGVFVTPTYESNRLIIRGKLRVAIKGRSRSSWIIDLAHEYVHMLQWFRDDPIFSGHFRGEIAYHKLEESTEHEAIRLLKRWGITISNRQLRRSQQYIAKQRENDKR